MRLAGDEGSDGFIVTARAGRDQGVDASKLDRYSTFLEELKNVGPPTSNGKPNRGHAVAAPNCRVGAVVEQEFDHLEAIVAANRLIERCHSPPRHPIRICGVFQYKAETVKIVPVALSQERGAEAPLVEFAAFEQDLDRKSTRLNSSHSGESRMPSSA